MKIRVRNKMRRRGFGKRYHQIAVMKRMLRKLERNSVYGKLGGTLKTAAMAWKSLCDVNTAIKVTETAQQALRDMYSRDDINPWKFSTMHLNKE